MKGGIYPYTDKRDGKTYYKVKFPGMKQKTFTNKAKAEDLLIGWQFKDREGTLDPRDYENDSPLQLKKLAKKYLQVKKANYKNARKGTRAFDQINRDIERLIHQFGERNVKTITFNDLEDWIFGEDLEYLSLKTLHNIVGVIRPFFKWAAKREKFPCPEFPDTSKFNLKMRNIVGIEVQQAVIDEVWRIYGKNNPKIALAVEWLSRYIGIRPAEMIHLKEKHVGVSGFLIVENTVSKEKETKMIALLDEDIEKINQFDRGGIEDYFFRHPKAYGRAKAGEQFAEGFPYHAWKRACDNLGVKNVDMYGGTRHSTATALGEHFTLAQIMEAGSMHKTNKAAIRYIQAKKPESLMVYRKVSDLQKAEIIDLEKVRKQLLERSGNGLESLSALGG